MRKIVHCSDLHFGRNDEVLVNLMIKKINQSKPDLVVVSGDLTERATEKQFKKAKAFLDKIPFKKLVIPGNHDVPLYNIYYRFLKPFVRYKKYISQDLGPKYEDDEIIVQGINTARSFAFTRGKIRETSIAEIAEHFEDSPNKFKILVTHHPFILVPDFPVRDFLRRRKFFFKKIKNYLPDLILSGHYHYSYTGQIKRKYLPKGKKVAVSLTGSSFSTRTRKQINSYNIIQISGEKFKIKRYDLVGKDN